MASIAKKHPAAAVARARRPRQRSKTAAKTRTPAPAPAPDVIRSVLIGVVDELNDLEALLGCVPELQRMGETVQAILEARRGGGRGDDPSADRIGELARALGSRPLRVPREALSIVKIDAIELRGMDETLTAAIRLRLIRTARAIELAIRAKKPHAKTPRAQRSE